MLLNLTDVLLSKGKLQELTLELEMPVFTFQGIDYEVIEDTPLSLKLENLGEGEARIEGEMELRALLTCDRCLKDVPHTFVLNFRREVKAPDRVPGLTEEEADEQNFMEGWELNIDSLIKSEVLMSWPAKVLCHDDCKGICPQCGMDLNTGQCGCDTFVPDPRMAAIKDIFNANHKEV